MAITVPRSSAGADGTFDASASSHYVDWGVIAAGAFVAGAISSVFIAFGSAIGLSLTSFQNGSSASAAGLLIAAALWLLWVQVSSFMGGGYIAGRMRRRIGDATAHEVEMRDGAHGLLVWAVGVVAGAVVAAWLAMAGITGVANVASLATANSGAVDYYVDRLLRADTAATTPDAASTGVNGQSPPQSQQMARVLTRSLGGAGLDDSDKSYLAREVSMRTGLPQAEAEKRVDETVAALKTQADTARRYGILFAFLAAASLLISAVGAWWAACAGGRHRNEGVDHGHLTRWR